MLSFVSQHQELDTGGWYVYSDKDKWQVSTSQATYFPDSVMMTKETADLMLKAIKNGSLDLS